MKILLLVLSVSAMSVYGLCAQTYFIETYSTERGLSQNTVNCLHQDKQGFIWAGTYDGLNRYDGYEFRAIRIEDGLRSNLIRAIYEDKEENLWVGTGDRGVFIYNYRTDQTDSLPPHQLNVLKKIQSKHITEIKEPIPGVIMVLSTTMLYVIDKRTDTWRYGAVTVSKKSKAYCFEYFADKIWIGTGSGLFVVDWNRDDNTLQMNRFPHANFVRGMTKYNDGLLIASKTLHFVDRHMHMTAIKADSGQDVFAKKILIDNQNHIWAGGAKGVYVLTQKDGVFTLLHQLDASQNQAATRLCNENILSLTEDRSGNIWVGTKSCGILKIIDKDRKYKFPRKSTFVQDHARFNVNALFRDSQDNLWVGFDQSYGASLISRERQQIGHLGFIKPESQKQFALAIRAIHELRIDGQRTLLFAASHKSGNQSVIIDDATGKWSIQGFPRQLSKLGYDIRTFESDSAYLWIGTFQNGLYRYDLARDILVNFRHTDESGSLASDLVRSLFLDTQHRLWIGTDRGLHVLSHPQQHLENPRFHVFTHDPHDPTSISLDYILPITETRNHDIWIGTMGRGLNRFNESDSTFDHINTSDGLANANIKAIEEDEIGNLWVSTNKGISKIDLASGLIKNYGIEDGLQGFEFSELASQTFSDGSMVFGGKNGINIFHPEHIARDTITPLLALTDLFVLNRKVHAGQKVNGRVLLRESINYAQTIRLTYEESSFSVHFAGISHQNQSKNTYQYRLFGFEEEWVSTSSANRIAKYTSIPPGAYTLQIKAINGDGVETPVRDLSIVVQRPWWLGNIAIAAYVTILGALMMMVQAFFRYRLSIEEKLRHQRIEREKLEMKMQEQVAEVSPEPAVLVIENVGKDEHLIAEMVAFLEQNMEEGKCNVPELANACAMSKSTLNRKIKAITGHTAKRFVRKIQLQKAKQLLETGEYAVSEVTYKVGFNDLAHFRELFKEEYGMGPGELRKYARDKAKQQPISEFS